MGDGDGYTLNVIKGIHLLTNPFHLLATAARSLIATLAWGGAFSYLNLATAIRSGVLLFVTPHPPPFLKLIGRFSCFLTLLETHAYTG